MNLSNAARLDGADRCGRKIKDAPQDVFDNTAARTARRTARGPPLVLQPPIGTRRPIKRRPKRRTCKVSPPPTAPRRSESSRLNAMWSSSAGVVKTKNPSRTPKGPRRRAGGAVLLPSCERRRYMLAELERLLRAGVRREARPRKLQLTLGLVEFVTNALQVPRAGTLICGQAALESATGLSLDALGIERWQPSLQPACNLLTFACMNVMLEDADAVGKAFVLRKPLHRLDLATAAFGRDTGVFVINAYHLPGDDFEGGLQLPYGTEVMGCRCGLLALQPQPFTSPLTASHTPDQAAGVVVHGSG